MAKRKLERLSKSILEKPQLATKEQFQEIKDYLDSRNHDEDLAVASQKDAREMAHERVPVENGIAILDISGPLSYRHSWINSLCGLTSYQSLLADFEEAVAMGAHTVVFDMDSGGGEAYSCFSTADAIRAVADENNVRIIAYNDGTMASACYALAAIADEIIVNPMAKTGSIGVVVSIFNSLPKAIEDGNEVIFVHAGESKIPYDKDGKIRKEQIKEIQDDVDALYLEFIDHVGKYRPMTSSEIRGTEAKMFRADKAIELGLVDAAMTQLEFMDYLADLSEAREENMALFTKKKKEELSQSSGSNSEELTNEDIDSSESTQTDEGVENMSDIQMTQEELEAQLAAAREAAQAEVLAQAKELQEKLDAIETKEKAEKLEGIKASLKEYSFIQEDHGESLASFLMDHEGSPVAEALSATLKSAQAAVEAGLDIELGDAGTEIETSQLDAEKDAMDKVLEARYNK